LKKKLEEKFKNFKNVGNSFIANIDEINVIGDMIPIIVLLKDDNKSKSASIYIEVNDNSKIKRITVEQFI